MFDGSIVDAKRIQSRPDVHAFVNLADHRTTSRTELITVLEREVKACQQVREEMQAEIKAREKELEAATEAYHETVDDAVGAGAKLAKKLKKSGPQRRVRVMDKMNQRLEVVAKGQRHIEPLFADWWPEPCKTAIKAAQQVTAARSRLHRAQSWLASYVDDREDVLEAWIQDLRKRDEMRLDPERELSDEEKQEKAVAALDLSAEEKALTEALEHAGLTREEAEAKVAELAELAKEVSDVLRRHDEAVVDVAYKFQTLEGEKKLARYRASEKHPKYWVHFEGWNLPADGRPAMDAIQYVRDVYRECKHVTPQVRFDFYEHTSMHRVLKMMLNN